MTENEWKQRFELELLQRQVPIEPDQAATFAHMIWLSSSGVAPESIAAAVAEAWHGRLPPADSLLSAARRQVLETREVLRRLDEKRSTFELRLLDSIASVCRDPCSTAFNPDDGFEAIIGQHELLPGSMTEVKAQSPSVTPAYAVAGTQRVRC